MAGQTAAAWSPKARPSASNKARKASPDASFNPRQGAAVPEAALRGVASADTLPPTKVLGPSSDIRTLAVVQGGGVMSVIARSFFLLAAVLLPAGVCVQASTGVSSQLPVPTGASVKLTATTPAWTIVSNSSANFVTPRGEVVTAAGELLIYSNATGRLTRRLRSPVPSPFANMGVVMAASGDVVVVNDGTSSVRAFHCGTGVSLWRRDFHPYAVGGIAMDSGRVLVGIVDTLLIGTHVLNAATGEVQSSPAWNSDMDYFPGSAVAICGPWLAIGSPRTKVGAFTGAGVVQVVNPFGASFTLGPPTASNGLQFGTSVAISGTSLYVGCVGKSEVYHYDLRTQAFVGTILPPSPVYTGFGRDLRASGHLLLILSSDGLWLHDRQTGSLNTILWQEAGAIGFKVVEGGSLCGAQVTAPAGGKVFRAVGVAGGRLGGSLVAVTKTAAGGVGGATFSLLTDATLNAAGSALFTARMSGSGVSAGSDAGLWTGVTGMQQLRLREGSLSGTTKAGTPFRPFFSVDNSTYYSLNRSSAGAVGLWGGTGGSAPLVVPGGSVFLQGVGTPLSVAKLHSAGAVLSSAAMASFSLKPGGSVTLGNDSVIARPGLVFSIEAREGSSSGLLNAPHAQLHPRLATAGTRLAFASFLSGRASNTNAAVFTKVIGGSQVAAIQKGEAAPGAFEQFTDGFLSSFTGEAISPAVTVIRGTYKTAAFTAEGIWSFNNATMQKHSVAWARGQVPGFPAGTTWRRLLKTFATTDGTILFLARISGPGITTKNDVGLWRCSLGSNAPTVLVREGQLLPGTHEAVLGTIQQVDVGSDGTWALLASLSRSASSQNQILIGGRTSLDSGFNLLTRKGLGIDGAVNGALQLSLSLPANTTDAAGMGTLGQGRAAESSRVLYQATFKHGTELATTGIWGY